MKSKKNAPKNAAAAKPPPPPPESPAEIPTIRITVGLDMRKLWQWESIWSVNVGLFGHTLFDIPWEVDKVLETNVDIPLVGIWDRMANEPLHILMKNLSENRMSKPPKSPKSARSPKGKKDSLTNLGCAGANVDLIPLVLGQMCTTTKVYTKTDAGEKVASLCIRIELESHEPIWYKVIRTTLHRVCCVPSGFKGDVCYGAAIAIPGNLSEVKICHFGSGSKDQKSQVVFPALLSQRPANASLYKLKEEVCFVDPELKTVTQNNPSTFYWGSTVRVLTHADTIDPRLKQRLVFEFAIMLGPKMDVKAKFVALIDLKFLFEPNEVSVAITSPLYHYNAYYIEKHYNMGPMLGHQPPAIVRDKMSQVTTHPVHIDELLPLYDESGNQSYVVISFDVNDSIVNMPSEQEHFDMIGIPCKEPLVYTWSQKPLPKPKLTDQIPERMKELHQKLKSKTEVDPDLIPSIVELLQELFYERFDDKNTNEHEDRENITKWFRMVQALMNKGLNYHDPKPEPLICIKHMDFAELINDKETSDMILNNLLKKYPEDPKPWAMLARKQTVAGLIWTGRETFWKALRFQPNNIYLLRICGALESVLGHREVPPYLYDVLNTYPEYRDKMYHPCTCNPGTGLKSPDVCLKECILDSTRLATTLLRLSNKDIIGEATLHTHLHFSKNIYGAAASKPTLKRAGVVEGEVYNIWEELWGNQPTWDMIYEPCDVFTNAAAFYISFGNYEFAERLLQCSEMGCDLECEEPESDWRVGMRHYLRAVSSYFQKNYEETLQLILNAEILLGPSYYFSRLRGFAFIGLNNDVDAARSFKESRDAGAPPMPAALQIEATISRDIDLAMKTFTMFPQPCSAILLAELYAERGNEAGSEWWAEIATSMNPSCGTAWAHTALGALKQPCDVRKALALINMAKHCREPNKQLLEEIELKRVEVIRRTAQEILDEDSCSCQPLDN